VKLSRPKLVLVLFVLTSCAFGCAAGAYDTSGRPWPTTSQDKDLTPEAASVASSKVNLDLGEFFIEGDLLVPAGGVILQLANKGVIEHNVRLVGGPLSETLPADSTSQLDVGQLAAGTYQLICELPGHKDAGMVATLTVVK
jgi:plastocyanin|tara:strand:+ start:529 stop:951 length:423 start_codon:yes stop_codon:yes gene_type:complete